MPRLRLREMEDRPFWRALKRGLAWKWDIMGFMFK
jgi:hypothetical protein